MVDAAPRWRRVGCRVFALGGSLAAVLVVGALVAFPPAAPQQVGSSNPKFGFCSEQPSASAQLLWGSNPATADHICCEQHDYAEFWGYWQTTSFPTKLSEGETITFYDVASQVPLFRAPVGRTFDEFVAESTRHGWPSFRAAEKITANVRELPGGEMVSVNGTRASDSARREHAPRLLRAVGGRPRAVLR